MTKIYGIKTCSSTKKALNIFKDADFFDYKTQQLDLEQLTKLYNQSQLPINKWLNTSGNSYKAINKETRKTYSTKQWLELMAKDNLLIKRPMILYNNQVLVGNDYLKEKNENFK